PPWMSDEEYERPNDVRSLFVAVYPGFISFVQPHQVSMITTEHIAVDHNRAASHISVAPWALERDSTREITDLSVEFMKAVQAEDSFGCHMLQKGAKAASNDFSVLHPDYEKTLQHFHRWLLRQYMTA